MAGALRTARGGIAGLLRLIRDHADAVEADLPTLDLRHLFMPGGGPSRLTLRRLAWQVRHLPRESATAKAQGADGFSQLELLVMENGMAGPLNPRHPFHEAERAKVDDRARLIKERAAWHAARSTSAVEAGLGGEPVDGSDDEQD